MAGSRATVPLVLLVLPVLSACNGPGLRRSDGTGLPELRLLARVSEQPVDSRPAAADPALPRVAEADLMRFGAEDMRANELVAQAYADGGRRGLEALPAGDTSVQRLARGKALLRLAQPAEAAVFFEGLLRDDPEYLPARAGLGQARLLQGRSDEAVQVLSRVQTLWPANPDARFVLAQALQKSQKLDEAIEVLRGLVPAGPLAAPAACVLGRILWERRQFREGLDLMAATLAAAPDSVDVRAMYGSFLEERGQFAAAREQFERALEGRAPPPHTRLRLIHVLRALGRFQDAQQHCQKLRDEVAQGISIITPAELERLTGAIAEELRTGERQGYSLPEVRGILAGSTDQTRRLQALAYLGRADLRVVGPDLRGLLLDEDPLLRLLALRMLSTRAPLEAELIGRSLADADPRVRTEALGFAGQLPEATALPLLVNALRREQDPATFRATHEALEKRSGQRLFLESGAEREAGRRAAVVAEWSRRLP